MANKTYDIIRATRTNFLKLVDALTLDELNQVPPGFANNIAWNLCHIVAAQQTICYIKASAVPRLPMEHITKFQKGTKPEGLITRAEIDYYKDQLFTLIDALEHDEHSGYLANYQSFTTVYGVELSSAADAVNYVSSHDALHYGYALALKRAILSSQLKMLAGQQN